MNAPELTPRQLWHLRQVGGRHVPLAAEHDRSLAPDLRQLQTLGLISRGAITAQYWLTNTGQQLLNT